MFLHHREPVYGKICRLSKICCPNIRSECRSCVRLGLPRSYQAAFSQSCQRESWDAGLINFWEQLHHLPQYYWERYYVCLSRSGKVRTLDVFCCFRQHWHLSNSIIEHTNCLAFYLEGEWVSSMHVLVRVHLNLMKLMILYNWTFRGNKTAKNLAGKWALTLWYCPRSAERRKTLRIFECIN